MHGHWEFIVDSARCIDNATATGHRMPAEQEEEKEKVEELEEQKEKEPRRGRAGASVAIAQLESASEKTLVLRF